jgi:FkbM family methyltransferase
MNHASLNESMPIADVKALFAQAPGPWPAGWAGMPNVCQAFREMFDAAAHSLPAPPHWETERGIVICAGGWRFFASLYVTVRMIRHVGCELPIQVWYLGDWGEFDPRMEQALERFDVGWINGQAFARDHGLARRILGGWEMKAFAAAHCPFREVISLDADSYPAYDPEEFMAHPEYQRVGAAFWPDQGKLEPGQWERFGLPYHDEPAWETGQFIIDKARHWQPLALASWLNDHSDYVYHHIYGDKDTFHLAWRKLGHEVCVPTSSPGWNTVAFLQMDFDGRTLFVHRTRDKFRWDGDIDGREVPKHYMTAQWNAVNQFVAGLPHEDAAHEFCRESSELLRPELHFACRPNSGDRGIFIEVWLQNEYRLPPKFEPDDVIVDIGGNVGAFAHACLTRGAGRVITAEPEPGNVAVLRQNLARWGDRVEIILAAVWPGDVPAPELVPADDPIHTCQFSMLREGEGQAVPTVTLQDVLARAGGRVRLLKLDCEGAEYAILDGVDLSNVDQVCGEAHALDWRGRNWSVEDVAAALGEAFEMTTFKNGPDTWLFWALPR